VQARSKIHWQHQKVHVYYNPSAYTEAAFKLALCTTLMSFGTSIFPLFDLESLANTKGLKLTIFYLSRKTNDYHVILGNKVLKETCDRFPKKQDVDNMLKFVMDTLHDVIYNNDNVITHAIVIKEFVPESGHEGPAHMEVTLEKRL
jgi:hypothetical protein